MFSGHFLILLLLLFPWLWRRRLAVFSGQGNIMSQVAENLRGFLARVESAKYKVGEDSLGKEFQVRWC